MADISVHIFVQNLRELLKPEHSMIAAEKLQALYDGVYHLSNFIKKTEEKCSVVDDDEKVSNLLTEIRKVVLEAENVVDYFMMDEISLDLKTVQKKIEEVKIEVDQIMNSSFDDRTTTVSGDHGKKKKIEKTRERSTDEDHLEAAAFGIDETIEKILAGFDAAAAEMEVISVVGLPGIGKTTLAQKVFDHSRTRSSFQVRSWVTVSQTYNVKRLLIDILRSASLYEDGDEDSTEDRLGEHLLKRLKDKKYLVVLDDIWSIDAWIRIYRSFPNQHNGSKVLFTSRVAVIGKDLVDINTHHVSGLSEEDSWNLLQNKVFGGDERRIRCPMELEKFGREIAKKCDGLPLAIVVVGGLLAKKEKTTEVWERLARSLASAIASDREAYMDTLALSYHNLPVHLKACFLYLGSSIFPEDHEIPVRKLLWLLVAEGFVIQQIDGRSLEVTAEGYLNELVERSLVTVARKRSCGATKTFRIHDLLRDFCLVRGKQEMFFSEHSFEDAHSYSLHSVLKEQRRLHVNSAWYHFQDKRQTSNLRSLFYDYSFFDRDCCASEDCFVHTFRLLKVLHLRYVWCNCLDEIEKMVHLKYLAVEDSLSLASRATKLLCLETLLLHTGYPLDLPDGVWNMVKLRHLYSTEGLIHFKTSGPQGAKKSSAILGNLQTLHTLCACRSCLKKLVRTPNLIDLGLSGSLISASGCSTIPDLGFLERLETLKVTNSSCYSHRSSVVVKLRLPASLRKLTLQNTLLKWEEISLLAQLENLEVLKLLDYAACVEEEDEDSSSQWETSELEFPKLKYLKMRRLHIVKWEDENLQCESLEVLVLEGCHRLEAIPLDLALSPSLHTIEVTRCNNTLEILAKEIVEEHENQCGNNNLRVLITS